MSTSIRLKNSSALVGGKAKAPVPTDLAQGELAVNINKDDPSLFVKDSEGVVRKIAGSDATGVEGEYLSLAADAEAQTVATSETTTFTGQVDLPGGGNDTQALQKQEVQALIDASDTGDGKYVEKAGDTMTGQLTLPGGGSDTQALQKQEVEALIDASDTGAGKYVEKAGDTMTGQLTLPGGGGDAQALQKQEVEALIADPDGPADGNYLKLGAGTFDQTVASTGTTTFDGLVEAGNGVQVTGGVAGDGKIIGTDDGVIRLGDNSSGLDILPSSVQGMGNFFTTNWISVGNASEGLQVISDATNATSVMDVNLQRNLLTANQGDPKSLSFYSSVTAAEQTGAGKYLAFNAALNQDLFPNGQAFGFYSDYANLPHFFAGNTYIGGTVAGDTRELWE